MGVAAIVQAVAAVGSFLYQRQAQKKAERKARERAQQAREASLGQQVRPSGSAEPINILYGYTATTGTTVFVDTNSNFNSYGVTLNEGSKAAQDLLPSTNRLPVTSTGKKNQFLMSQTVLGLGKINKVVTYDIDGTDFDEEEYDDAVYISISRQTNTEDRVARGFSGSGRRPTSAKFTDLSYATNVFKLDREDPQFNGVPSIYYYIEGNQVYDPRDDTTKFSNNPALVLLDFLTSDAYGPGWDRDDDLDIESFKTAADLADEVGKVNAAISGKVFGDATTRNINRYEFNGALDSTATDRDNIEEILAVVPGVEFFRSADGKWKLVFPDADQTEANQSVKLITDSDLVSGITVSFPETDSRLNQQTVKFSNASKDFAADTLTRPMASSTLYQNWLEEDGDFKLIGTLSTSSTSNIYNAANLALQNTQISRLESYEFEVRPIGYTLEPGDIIQIRDPAVNLGEGTAASPNIYIKIGTVNVMSNLNVKIRGIRFSNENYAFTTTADEVIVDLPKPSFLVGDPVAISATYSSALNRIEVKWRADDSEDSSVTFYEVFWKLSTDGEEGWTFLTQKAVSAEDTELVYHTAVSSANYQYRIRAVTRDNRRSGYSNVVSATSAGIDVDVDAGLAGYSLFQAYAEEVRAGRKSGGIEIDNIGRSVHPATDDFSWPTGGEHVLSGDTTNVEYIPSVDESYALPAGADNSVPIFEIDIRGEHANIVRDSEFSQMTIELEDDFNTGTDRDEQFSITLDADFNSGERKNTEKVIKLDKNFKAGPRENYKDLIIIDSDFLADTESNTVYEYRLPANFNSGTNRGDGFEIRVDKGNYFGTPAGAIDVLSIIGDSNRITESGYRTEISFFDRDVDTAFISAIQNIEYTAGGNYETYSNFEDKPTVSLGSAANNGKSALVNLANWMTSRYNFEVTDDGYDSEVTPQDWGSTVLFPQGYPGQNAGSNGIDGFGHRYAPYEAIMYNPILGNADNLWEFTLINDSPAKKLFNIVVMDSTKVSQVLGNPNITNYSSYLYPDIYLDVGSINYDSDTWTEDRYIPQRGDITKLNIKSKYDVGGNAGVGTLVTARYRELNNDQVLLKEYGVNSVVEPSSSNNYGDPGEWWVAQNTDFTQAGCFEGDTELILVMSGTHSTQSFARRSIATNVSNSPIIGLREMFTEGVLKDIFFYQEGYRKPIRATISREDQFQISGYDNGSIKSTQNQNIQLQYRRNNSSQAVRAVRFPLEEPLDTDLDPTKTVFIFTYYDRPNIPFDEQLWMPSVSDYEFRPEVYGFNFEADSWWDNNMRPARDSTDAYIGNVAGDTELFIAMSLTTTLPNSEKNIRDSESFENGFYNFFGDYMNRFSTAKLVNASDTDQFWELDTDSFQMYLDTDGITPIRVKYVLSGNSNYYAFRVRLKTALTEDLPYTIFRLKMGYDSGATHQETSFAYRMILPDTVDKDNIKFESDDKNYPVNRFYDSKSYSVTPTFKTDWTSDTLKSFFDSEDTGEYLVSPGKLFFYKSTTKGISHLDSNGNPTTTYRWNDDTDWDYIYPPIRANLAEAGYGYSDTETQDTNSTDPYKTGFSFAGNPELDSNYIFDVRYSHDLAMAIRNASNTDYSNIDTLNASGANARSAGLYLTQLITEEDDLLRSSYTATDQHWRRIKGDSFYYKGAADPGNSFRTATVFLPGSQYDSDTKFPFYEQVWYNDSKLYTWYSLNNFADSPLDYHNTTTKDYIAVWDRTADTDFEFLHTFKVDRLIDTDTEVSGNASTVRTYEFQDFDASKFNYFITYTRAHRSVSLGFADATNRTRYPIMRVVNTNGNSVPIAGETYDFYGVDTDDSNSNSRRVLGFTPLILDSEQIIFRDDRTNKIRTLEKQSDDSWEENFNNNAYRLNAIPGTNAAGRFNTRSELPPGGDGTKYSFSTGVTYTNFFDEADQKANGNGNNNPLDIKDRTMRYYQYNQAGSSPRSLIRYFVTLDIDNTNLAPPPLFDKLWIQVNNQDPGAIWDYRRYDAYIPDKIRFGYEIDGAFEEIPGAGFQITSGADDTDGHKQIRDQVLKVYPEAIWHNEAQTTDGFIDPPASIDPAYDHIWRNGLSTGVKTGANGKYAAYKSTMRLPASVDRTPVIYRDMIILDDPSDSTTERIVGTTQVSKFDDTFAVPLFTITYENPFRNESGDTESFVFGHYYDRSASEWVDAFIKDWSSKGWGDDPVTFDLDSDTDKVALLISGGDTEDPDVSELVINVEAVMASKYDTDTTEYNPIHSEDANDRAANHTQTKNIERAIPASLLLGTTNNQQELLLPENVEAEEALTEFFFPALQQRVEYAFITDTDTEESSYVSYINKADINTPQGYTTIQNLPVYRTVLDTDDSEIPMVVMKVDMGDIRNMRRFDDDPDDPGYHRLERAGDLDYELGVKVRGTTVGFNVGRNGATLPQDGLTVMDDGETGSYFGANIGIVFTDDSEYDEPATWRPLPNRTRNAAKLSIDSDYGFGTTLNLTFTDSLDLDANEIYQLVYFNTDSDLDQRAIVLFFGRNNRSPNPNNLELRDPFERMEGAIKIITENVEFNNSTLEFDHAVLMDTQTLADSDTGFDVISKMRDFIKDNTELFVLDSDNADGDGIYRAGETINLDNVGETYTVPTGKLAMVFDRGSIGLSNSVFTAFNSKEDYTFDSDRVYEPHLGTVVHVDLDTDDVVYNLDTGLIHLDDGEESKSVINRIRDIYTNAGLGITEVDTDTDDGTNYVLTLDMATLEALGDNGNIFDTERGATNTTNSIETIDSTRAAFYSINPDTTNVVYNYDIVDSEFPNDLNAAEALRYIADRLPSGITVVDSDDTEFTFDLGEKLSIAQSFRITPNTGTNTTFDLNNINFSLPTEFTLDLGVADTEVTKYFPGDLNRAQAFSFLDTEIKNINSAYEVVIDGAVLTATFDTIDDHVNNFTIVGNTGSNTDPIVGIIPGKWGNTVPTKYTFRDSAGDFNADFEIADSDRYNDLDYIAEQLAARLNGTTRTTNGIANTWTANADGPSIYVYSDTEAVQDGDDFKVEVIVNNDTDNIDTEDAEGDLIFNTEVIAIGGNQEKYTKVPASYTGELYNKRSTAITFRRMDVILDIEELPSDAESSPVKGTVYAVRKSDRSVVFEADINMSEVGTQTFTDTRSTNFSLAGGESLLLYLFTDDTENRRFVYNAREVAFSDDTKLFSSDPVIVGFSVAPTPRSKYLGVYQGLHRSTEPSVYSWSLFKGSDGKDGKNGVAGAKGDKGDEGEAAIQTAEGTLYYTLPTLKTKPPATPTASSYNYTTDTFVGLTENWQSSPVEIVISDSTKVYWHVKWSAVRQPGSKRDRITFGRLIPTINFGTTIQSDNFQAGRKGWRIRRDDGDAEFNNIIARGNIRASSLTLLNGRSITPHIFALKAISGTQMGLSFNSGIISRIEDRGLFGNTSLTSRRVYRGWREVRGYRVHFSRTLDRTMRFEQVNGTLGGVDGTREGQRYQGNHIVFVNWTSTYADVAFYRVTTYTQSEGDNDPRIVTYGHYSANMNNGRWSNYTTANKPQVLIYQMG